MDIHNKKKFSFSEKQLTDKGKTSEHFKGINRHKKRKMNHSMDIRVIRDLNTIITDIKQKYLNDNDKLMLRLLINQKEQDKENPVGDETLRTISMMGNLVKYLGKTKLEFELDKESKVNSEMSEYEVHLQKLEAQIREHIRIEQQLKLFAESLQSKLDEYEKKEKLRKKESCGEELKLKLEMAEEENKKLVKKSKESDEEIKTLKKKVERLVEVNKRLGSEVKVGRSKPSSVDKFLKMKDSFMNHKNKSSRIKNGAEYKRIGNDFRKKDRKHLKTEGDKLSEYRRNYFDRSSKDLIGRKTSSKERIKENKGMLKHMLKKSSPPLPNEIRDRILHKTSKRLSRDRSSFLEKKRKSSRKRERTREDSQFKTSNSKIRQKETRRPIDRLRKKKNYEIMKSYSINSCHSVSIEKSKKTRERRKKGTSSRSKAEYGGNQGKFKGSSNYISRSFLRSGGDNKQMLKISDKLRTLKANYNK